MTTPATPDRKIKVTWNMKLALLEVIARKQLSDHVEYRAVALRFGVSAGGLKSNYCRYKKGCVDLGEPMTPQEVDINLRMQHERSIKLLTGYHQLLLDCFEAQLFRSRDQVTNKNMAPWADNAMPRTLTQIERVIHLKAILERGYNTILEDEMARRRGEEKALRGSVIPPEVQTAIVTANDEERGLAALTAGTAS